MKWCCRSFIAFLSGARWTDDENKDNIVRGIEYSQLIWVRWDKLYLLIRKSDSELMIDMWVEGLVVMRNVP